MGNAILKEIRTALSSTKEAATRKPRCKLARKEAEALTSDEALRRLQEKQTETSRKEKEKEEKRIQRAAKKSQQSGKVKRKRKDPETSESDDEPASDGDEDDEASEVEKPIRTAQTSSRPKRQCRVSAKSKNKSFRFLNIFSREF